MWLAAPGTNVNAGKPTELVAVSQPLDDVLCGPSGFAPSCRGHLENVICLAFIVGSMQVGCKLAARDVIQVLARKLVLILESSRVGPGRQPCTQSHPSIFCSFKITSAAFYVRQVVISG